MPPFLRLYLVLFAALFGFSAPSIAVDAPGVRKNSLGVTFQEIRGLPVSFARWETRVSDFEIFVKESGYDWNQKAPFAQTADHPVVNVNLADALAFCAWLTKKDHAAGMITGSQLYRLPTNEEWDVASGCAAPVSVRGVAAKPRNLPDEIFPWGTQWPPPPKAGNFSSKELGVPDDGYAYTSPVGSFDPSPTGLYDLAGNVWEWAWDEASRASGMATLRGGAWPYFRKESLLSAYRYAVPETLRKASVGFRIVFEDKAVAAGLVASAALGDKQRRELLTASSAVSQEEIETKRKQLTQKASITDEERKNATARGMRTGTEATPFVNSLGMKFQRLPSGNLLFGENQVREKEVAAWVAATGRVRTQKTSSAQTEAQPAVNISWSEAKEFCGWLTDREHYMKTITPDASYRLPTEAEGSAFPQKDLTEWCEDAAPEAPGERIVRGGSEGDLNSSPHRHLREGAFRPDLGFRLVLTNPRLQGP